MIASRLQPKCGEHQQFRQRDTTSRIVDTEKVSRTDVGSSVRLGRAYGATMAMYCQNVRSFAIRQHFVTTNNAKGAARASISTSKYLHSHYYYWMLSGCVGEFSGMDPNSIGTASMPSSPAAHAHESRTKRLSAVGVPAPTSHHTTDVATAAGKYNTPSGLRIWSIIGGAHLTTDAHASVT